MHSNIRSRVVSNFFLDGAKIIYSMNLLTFYIAAGIIALIIMIWLIVTDRKN